MEIRVITSSEVSKEFIQGMADRMEVSFHKYGRVMDAAGRIDELKCLEQRLHKYRDTGNTEWLIDVANFAMIEFMHKGAGNFRPTDSNESPGLAYKSGVQYDGPHSPSSKQISDQAADFYRTRR